jgi:hypothetical protein
MEKTLSLSGNNLADVVNWLKEGYFVCLYNSSKKNAHKVYYSKDSLVNEEMISIDLINWPDLLDEDEWPWYIKNAGFVMCNIANVFPRKEYCFVLP